MSTEQVNELLAQLPEWGILLAAGLSLLGSAWTAWHVARTGGRGIARVYRWVRPVRPLSPLCQSVLKALDHPRPRLVDHKRIEAGGVVAQAKYPLLASEPELETLCCGKGSTENVRHLLTPREEKLILARMKQLYKHINEQDAELKAAHAVAALNLDAVNVVEL